MTIFYPEGVELSYFAPIKLNVIMYIMEINALFFEEGANYIAN